jgi:hypothetical protein
MLGKINGPIDEWLLQIRKVRSEESLLKLLSFSTVASQHGSTDAALNFLRDLRNELSRIDPIQVVDCMEWTMIQAARVYLHRIIAQRHLQMTH